MTQDKVQTKNSAIAPATDEDNVVTRAQQGHLTLLDWQTANPLSGAGAYAQSAPPFVGGLVHGGRDYPDGERRPCGHGAARPPGRITPVRALQERRLP